MENPFEYVEYKHLLLDIYHLGYFGYINIPQNIYMQALELYEHYEPNKEWLEKVKELIKELRPYLIIDYKVVCVYS